MTESIYQEEQLDVIDTSNMILLVTATDLETRILHTKIDPISGYPKIVKVFKGAQTYFIGKFGAYKIVHVQCGMGSISRDSSIITVSEAVAVFKPVFTLMIGIAFGVDDVEQNIGDILIADALFPYNYKKIASKKTVQRAADVRTSKKLLNRFKHIKTTWQHILPDNKIANITTAHLLSGEELIDNLTHRNKLLAMYPTAKGGEMEGVGVSTACEDKCDWMLVKGICDFADGKKSHEKDKRQAIAMNSAVSACLEVFSSNSAFKEYNILPLCDHDTVSNYRPIHVNEVLFDLYADDKKEYYVVRNEDNIFQNMLQHYSIWLHGPSGCGKSNIIIRNLRESSKKYIQISLASYTSSDVDMLFREILYELASSNINAKAIAAPTDIIETHKAIIAEIEKSHAQQELYIFIEEIPLESEDDYKAFTQNICALLIAKNLNPALQKVKFVLSSIHCPEHFVLKFQQKVHQQLKFRGLQFWNDHEVDKLVLLILGITEIRLSPDFQKKLVTASKGSPRFIKKFFRNAIAIMDFTAESLTEVIEETKRELKF